MPVPATVVTCRMFSDTEMISKLRLLLAVSLGFVLATAGSSDRRRGSGWSEEGVGSFSSTAALRLVYYKCYFKRACNG